MIRSTRSFTYAILSGALLLASCTNPSTDPVASQGDVTGDATGLAKSSVAQDRIPDSYIVVLNENVRSVPDVASEMARAYGLSRGYVYQNSIRGFSATIPAGRLNALARDPRVKYIEPDRIVALAPPPGKGPGGGGGDTPPPGQETPWGITRVGGGATYTGNAVAWIIDSGIDLDHPDLNVDVARSVDFTNSRKGADDENGHGTHVAGTVAAIDNEFGVVGVAAGATVVAVRVLDRRGSGSYSGVIAGIDYVGANGANGDEANMSLGGGFSQALNDAVVAASGTVKFSLAAGNESTNAGTRSPASANGNNIYTVSAFAQGDTWASFSNYGNPPVDYAAPGVGVTSTYKDGGYTTYNGTSMAAPHVAGLLLLGNIRSGGYVSGDPDGNPDPIAVH